MLTANAISDNLKSSRTLWQPDRTSRSPRTAVRVGSWSDRSARRSNNSVDQKVDGYAARSESSHCIVGDRLLEDHYDSHQRLTGLFTPPEPNWDHANGNLDKRLLDVSPTQYWYFEVIQLMVMTILFCFSEWHDSVVCQIWLISNDQDRCSNWVSFRYPYPGSVLYV
jgi:hypothetical protein